jgi:hypothetical protein
MALSAEQQSQVDIQLAVETARQSNTLEMETVRNTNMNTLENKRNKLEAIRLAQQTLIENSRSLPADQRQITASDITTFAATIQTYINS